MINDCSASLTDAATTKNTSKKDEKKREDDSDRKGRKSKGDVLYQGAGAGANCTGEVKGVGGGAKNRGNDGGGI